MVHKDPDPAPSGKGVKSLIINLLPQRGGVGLKSQYRATCIIVCIRLLADCLFYFQVKIRVAGVPFYVVCLVCTLGDAGVLSIDCSICLNITRM
jgi:hypothetical protein